MNRYRKSATSSRITSRVFAATFLVGALWPPFAAAEPYMALREGWSCGDCHTNRTGGGMRNVTVDTHAADILNLPNGGKGIFGDTDERFSPRLSDWITVGADFRVADRLVFQDEPEEDGEVENNTAFREPDSNDVDIDLATVYGEIRLIPDKLSFYVDERFAPGGADNREAFLLLDGVLPGQTYAKGGRFFAPWGLKLQDDEAFVNALTGFSFDRSVTGLEIGRSGEGINWSLSGSEATEDDDLDQLFTANAYYLWSEAGPFQGIMLGASAATDEPGDTQFDAYTTYGGFSVGPLAVLGQGALVDTDVDGDSTKTWVAYGEANWLLAGWINTKVAFDWADPDDGTDEDERNRVSFGFEPFLDRFLQVRLFYRVLNAPEDDVERNRDELILELHGFF
jgi:hypothetical protein